MKIFTTIGVFGALSLSSLVGAATANHNLRVNVPFAFVVAGEQFKAGSYEVTETQNGVITVQGEGKAAAVISVPGTSPKAGDAATVSFRSSNSQEYLSGIDVQGESRAVPVAAYQTRSVRVSSR